LVLNCVISANSFVLIPFEVHCFRAHVNSYQLDCPEMREISLNLVLNCVISVNFFVWIPFEVHCFRAHVNSHQLYSPEMTEISSSSPELALREPIQAKWHYKRRSLSPLELSLSQAKAIWVESRRKLR
jgi:hypothetical protein